LVDNKKTHVKPLRKGNTVSEIRNTLIGVEVSRLEKREWGT
jgi:hypothetical protein